MKTCFVGIIAVAFLGGTIVSILPSGATQKYLRLLCALCVSASIILPIFSFFADGDFELYIDGDFYSEEMSDESYYVEIYNKSIEDAEEKVLENVIKNEVIQEFLAKLDDFDIDIAIEQKSDEFYISTVHLKIHPSGVALDPHKIKKYIDQRLECDCIVVYD